jgi:hypothetical protein
MSINDPNAEYFNIILKRIDSIESFMIEPPASLIDNSLFRIDICVPEIDVDAIIEFENFTNSMSEKDPNGDPMTLRYFFTSNSYSLYEISSTTYSPLGYDINTGKN